MYPYSPVCEYTCYIELHNKSFPVYSCFFFLVYSKRSVYDGPQKQPEYRLVILWSLLLLLFVFLLLH